MAAAPPEFFDYVVVGAGSAGCAVASRLSEEPSRHVALIEAGPPDRDPWIHIPVGYYRTAFGSRLTWGYRTVPEPGLGGRTLSWPRGKVLGGSSAINGLIYMRGQPEDFERWRQLGNQGWGWDDLLPVFRRIEDQERGESELHGIGGPLGVADLRLRHPLCDAYVRAAQECGIPLNPDFNGRSQEGVGFYQLTLRGRFRASAALSYLRPARRRANLRIVTGGMVLRILFEGQRAVGVALHRDGAEQVLRARREVILCAGAIGSPQLLAVSGIGPAETLRDLGIGVLHDAPGVGANLQDHFQAKAVFRCSRPVTINDDMKSLWRKASILAEYLLKGSGPMTIGAGQVGVFARTQPGSATPDVQFHVMPGSTDDPAKGMHDFPGFTSSICQLRPESRGWLRIVSPDARVHPEMCGNYLATETDRRVVIDGLKLARRISRAPALGEYFAGEYLPGDAVQADDEWLDYARRIGSTIYHPSGTCRMGPDEAAVVDPELRVRGAQGLRVADASIMPTLISGNTNAACMVIGERCAALAKAAEAA